MTDSPRPCFRRKRPKDHQASGRIEGTLPVLAGDRRAEMQPMQKAQLDSSQRLISRLPRAPPAFHAKEKRDDAGDPIAQKASGSTLRSFR